MNLSTAKLVPTGPYHTASAACSAPTSTPGSSSLSFPALGVKDVPRRVRFSAFSTYHGDGREQLPPVHVALPALLLSTSATIPPRYKKTALEAAVRGKDAIG